MAASRFVRLALLICVAGWASWIPQTRKLAESRPMGIRAAEDAATGGMPLHFEPNVGQLAPSVDAVSRGPGYSLFLSGRQSTIAFVDGEHQASLALNLAGADPAVRGVMGDRQTGVSNYFKGNDRTRWRTGVPHYGRVEYDAVYPGIDLLYYGNEAGRLEHDFVVSPGAEPDRIRFTIDGADAALDSDGNLRLTAGEGEVTLRRPVAYQESDGRHEAVQAAYRLEQGREVRFALGAYDRERELVIDPVLEYSSFLGGTGDDQAADVHVDAQGNIYVAGLTQSSDLPATAGSLQPDLTMGMGTDVFVAKFSPGWQLLFCTYLGGYEADDLYAMRVDGSGNVYLVGQTASMDFPATSGVFQPSHGYDMGSMDGFVTKLAATGASLIYSSYLGGASSDGCYGVAIDLAGNAYVGGYTYSSDFPTSAGAYLGAPLDDAQGFVAKVAPAGDVLTYCTCLGGSGVDESVGGVAVDAAGHAFAMGTTRSTDFPTTTGAFQTAHGTDTGNYDGFVAKLNAAGTDLVYSTYLGGNGLDMPEAIAADSLGRAVVFGDTTSSNFPITGGVVQTSRAGGSDTFVTALASSGSALAWSTYVGGASNDFAVLNGLVLDGPGNVYVTGITDSSDFPMTPGALQASPLSATDGFVAKLDAGGGSLAFSTCLGGSGYEEPWGLALGPSGRVYVAGWTNSADFPITSDAQQMFIGGGQDAFVAKLDLTRTIVTSTADSGPGTLRDAIEWANLQPAGTALTIDFNLPNGVMASVGRPRAGIGGLAATISLSSALPTLTRADVTFDGRTQSGYSSDPLVFITNGGAAFTPLTIAGTGCTILGLGFNDCDGTAVRYLSTASGGTVQFCWFGLDDTGLVSSANGVSLRVEGGGTVIGASDGVGMNRFGGATSASVQLIASGCAVASNVFGLGTDGTTALPSVDGVVIGGSNNQIGGDPGLEGNTIANCTGSAVVVADGAVGNTIQGNGIHGNGNGVVLQGTGNSAIPAPVLQLVTEASEQTTVRWTWSGGQTGPYHVEFYTTPIGGNPQGESLLGSQDVSAIGGPQTTVLSGGPATNEELTALLTDANGNTSAFSAAMLLATQLGFAQQPVGGQVHLNLPASQVEVLDSSGTRIDAAVTDVAIVLLANPGSATLTGTTTRQSAAGVATFDDLQLDLVGAGYTVQATSPPLAAADSNAFDVKSGPTDAGQTTATVPDGTVGETLTIDIAAYDAYGNPREVGGDTFVVQVSGANSLTPTVADHGDGTYSADYTPTVSGTDSVAITIGGTAIADSPFSSQVQPGPTDPTSSTATVPNGVAGAATAIGVVARDAYGNARPAGGDEVVVDVTGANSALPAVTDHGDGTYAASYTPTVSGSDTVTITINGTAIQDSPATSEVSAGPADAAHTTANVPNGEAGMPTVVTIQARDANDNLRTTGGDTVTVSVTGGNTGSGTTAAAVAVMVTDHGDGSYTTQYTPVAAGTDSIAIQLNGSPIQGSPYTSQVAAGSTSADASTANVPDGSAGVATLITVQARDADGNPRMVGGDTVVVDVTGANTATPSVSDLGDGTYAAQYIPTMAGTDQVSISLNGNALQGSPYTSQVSAGSSSADASTAAVPDGTAGQATQLTVQARDADGNPRAVGGDTVVVEVSGANAATPVVTDGGDGTYTAQYTPTVAGADAVAITLNGNPLQGSPFASQVAPAAVDQDSSSLAADPATAVANGADAVVLALVLRDRFGNPVPGIEAASIGFTAPVSSLDGDGLQLSGPAGPSDAAGAMTLSARATRPQTATLEATFGALAWRVDVAFSRRAVDAGRSEVGLAPDLIASDGSEQAAMTVILRDAAGVPVEGVSAAERSVGLTGDAAGEINIVSDGGTTGQDGVYQVAVSATDGGNTAITPQVGETVLSSVTLRSRAALDLSLPSGISFLTVPMLIEPDSLTELLALPGVQAAWWNPASQSYVPVPWPGAPVEELAMFGPGQAIWLRCDAPKVGRLYGVLTPLETQRIPLAQGWNGIGNPFPVPLAWDLASIRVEVLGYDIGSLADESLWTTTVKPYGWAWNAATEQYVLVFDPTQPGFSQALGVLPTQTALWVSSLRAGVTLVFPPPSRAASRGVRAVGPRDWTAGLTASLDGASDGGHLFGASAGLTNALGIDTPPLPVGRAAPPVSLAFLDPLGDASLSCLLQPGAGRSYTWQAEVTSRAAGEVTLTWPGLLRELPRGVVVELTDQTTGQTTLLNTRASYHYTGRAGEQRRFAVNARYGNIQRSEITALQVTPSRGAGTTLTLTTSGPAEVGLTVRGLGGRLVKQFSRTVPSGTTSLEWDGTDQAGRRVPRGTYQVEAVAVSANGAVSRAVRTVVVD